MKIRLVLILCVFSLLVNFAQAKVSDNEAKMLGTELTSLGAIKIGNEDGSIPAFTSGAATDSQADYVNDQRLFTITSKNFHRYKEKLTPGQLAMFNKFPNTYAMPVYPTRRTANFPDHVKDKAKRNATTTELVEGGNGMKNFDETVPFAIPKSGLEVMWNHVSRYRGGSIERNAAQIPVQRDGSFVPIKMRAQLTAPQYLKDGYDAKADENILFYYTQAIKSPARLSGNVLLVHETIDQVEQPRMAWSYNAGQRRVRRAPDIAYDAPGSGTEGLRTADQLDMFNGAPNKYDWELLGKKEIYIPYNAHKLMNPNAKYKEIVGKGHLNPEFLRYELHRVWIVEATLKEGERHIYSKRTFFVDEDSWQIALTDHYDTRGELWRLAEGHAFQFIEASTLWYAAINYYDILSSRYLVELNNEERNPFVFGNLVKRKDFTASALRRKGKR